MLRPIHADRREEVLPVNPLYSGLVPPGGVPRFQLSDKSMSADAARALIRDELILESHARLNLATYCTTWMEPQAKELIAECLDRNLMDHDQYPQTADIETRCVNILTNLWNDPDGVGVGCSTAGSSEAAMLAGLAMKFSWRNRRRAAGLSTDRPNLVMSTAVHTCWPKFCRYWDVEPRYVPISEPDYCVDPAAVAAACDENTIGMVAILGSSALGKYDPVAEISAELDRLQADRDINVPMHVDAAVGGFVTPFLDPERIWDFRLPRVRSINASGHKFGLVYPGVGWIVWEDRSDLAEELVFDCELLGGCVPTFTLNFSRSGAPVVAQYYNFLRLGFEGYHAVQETSREVAGFLGKEIARIPGLDVIADGTDLPVVGIRVRPGEDAMTVFDIHDRMRRHGWQIPAYHLPPDLEHIGVLRVVVRHGFSQDMAEHLVRNLRTEVASLLEGSARP
ncbi:glutamate decarboxylase [Streptomyces sp. NPDC053474]|uniref:glutamate decarboxylase n=1 Tax=Streptomyces sp. NPDC053474 TaxID=3365704 RepID=UPI0037CF8D84